MGSVFNKTTKNNEKNSRASSKSKRNTRKI